MSIKYFGILCSIAFIVPLTAQNTVKLAAVKANNYGVAYSLPQTAINITAEGEKVTRTTGEFYQYAERYLSVSDPITKDEVRYSLDKVSSQTIGMPNKDKSYLLEFKSNSVAPFVTLTQDGLICAVNTEAEFQPNQKIDVVANSEKKRPNPKSFLSEEILSAGSTAKQAELVAKQIYTLRETRNNILTGEADNMPPDGNAYKIVMEQLDTQEKALTSMFIGIETTEPYLQTFTIVPEDKNINRQVVFRFSSKLGIVSPDDLSGEPVYLTLTNKDPKPEVFLTEKEQKALDKKFSSGLIYNIPAKGDLKIEFKNKTLDQGTIDVVQYGTQEVLTPKELEYKKDRSLQIVFFPHLGAIKSMKEVQN